jgi:hypothetical protein
MSDSFFQRTWAVTVGYQGEEGKRFTSLRTTFDLDKSSASSSNKAKIDIYNLNPQTRADFQRKGLTVKLEAGYEGMLEILYYGDVNRTLSQRKGPDIITTFECGDAERKLTNAHFDKSYPAGTSYMEIIKDLAGALGVPIGTVMGIENMTYNSGVAFSGTVKSIMDAIMKRQPLGWNVQNGYLQIIPLKAHLGEEAVLLTKDTGLLGIPSQKESGIEFRSLLNPKLMPDCAVKLVSENINGHFKIKRATFKGDTHAQDWSVTAEAVRISPTQAYPQQNTQIAGSREGVA